MLLKHVNLTISIVSKVCKAVIVMYFAVFTAKVTLWIFAPHTTNLYIDPINIKDFDNSIKFIINRTPFGIVVTPPTPPKPSIASKIKLTGIYAGGINNSIVFYELDGKSYVAKIGDTIEGAVIKSITPNTMVISDNNVDAEIPLSNGGVQPNDISSNNNRQGNYPSQSPIVQQDNNDDMRDRQDMQAGVNSKDYSNSDTSSQSEDLVSKRKKMIEEFIRRRNSESGSPS